VTVLNGILSGLVILLAAVWCVYLHNWLWQRSLQQDAREALAAAQDLGLELKPLGIRARLVAVGTVGDRDVRIEWRGGFRGARTVVLFGDGVKVMAPITDAEGLSSVVARLTSSQG
jgi:hypothetical protein